MSTTNLENKIW